MGVNTRILTLNWVQTVLTRWRTVPLTISWGGCRTLRLTDWMNPCSTLSMPRIPTQRRFTSTETGKLMIHALSVDLLSHPYNYITACFLPSWLLPSPLHFSQPRFSWKLLPGCCLCALYILLNVSTRCCFDKATAAS